MKGTQDEAMGSNLKRPHRMMHSCSTCSRPSGLEQQIDHGKGFVVSIKESNHQTATQE